MMRHGYFASRKEADDFRDGAITFVMDQFPEHKRNLSVSVLDQLDDFLLSPSSSTPRCIGVVHRVETIPVSTSWCVEYIHRPYVLHDLWVFEDEPTARDFLKNYLSAQIEGPGLSAIRKGADLCEVELVARHVFSKGEVEWRLVHVSLANGSVVLD